MLFRSILDEFDHAYLNDVKSLQGMNPTSENLARLIFDRMAKELEQQPATVFEVEICESERSSVVYRP